MAAPWVAAAVQGGSGIFGNILTGINNKKENQRAREYDLQMYGLDKKLEWQQWNKQNEYSEKVWNMQNSYNEQMWNKMNAYNSPTAQMERFKNAGLNPNLIYGQSNTSPGITSAQFGKNTLGSTPRPTGSPMKHDFGDLGGSAFMQGLMQSELNSAQVSNTQANTEVAKEQARNLEVQRVGQGIENVGKGIRNKMSETELSNLITYAADAQAAAIAKQKAETGGILKNTEIAGNRDAREAKMNTAQLAQIATQMAKTQQETLTEQQRTALIQKQQEMLQEGYTPGDPLWQRKLMEAWISIKGDLKNAAGMQKWLSNYKD